MSVTKVVPFHGAMETPAGTAYSKPSESAPAAPPPSHVRFRQALQDTVPAETLMGQLRDIIAGPQARLTEARFEEMLDILEEQKLAGDGRMDGLELRMGQVAQDSVRMAEVLLRQQDDITGLSSRLGEDVRGLREQHEAAIGTLRYDLEAKLDPVAGALKQSTAELELSLRGGLRDLSSSFVVHIAEEEKRWERERQNTMVTLDQRIAQWRAEVEDGRNEDMGHLANSMMDIGQRLLALRKTMM